MKKYVVKISSVFSNIIDVEAEDEQDARDKARMILEDKDKSDDDGNNPRFKHYYESTFPPEHWPVITQEKYEELKKEVQEMADNKMAEDHSPN